MTNQFAPALVVACLLIASGSAHAEEKFTGSTAAYMDWASGHCGGKSTDKEHRLADGANDTGGAPYLKAYAQDRTKLEAITTPAAVDDMCANIKAWYGPDGTRIAGLVEWAKAGKSETVGTKSSADTPAKSGKGGGRKRGGS
jgi:hypothetical protein